MVTAGVTVVIDFDVIVGDNNDDGDAISNKEKQNFNNVFTPFDWKASKNMNTFSLCTNPLAQSKWQVKIMKEFDGINIYFFLNICLLGKFFFIMAIF